VETLKPTSIRLPQPLKKRLDQACLDRDVKKQDAVILAIEAWLAGTTPVGVADGPPFATAERPLYRRANQRWHAILEDVLNDPDEALGIQKNLEWAERTILEKRRRPAGRLASGE